MEGWGRGSSTPSSSATLGPAHSHPPSQHISHRLVLEQLAWHVFTHRCNDTYLSLPYIRMNGYFPTISFTRPVLEGAEDTTA